MDVGGGKRTHEKASVNNPQEIYIYIYIHTHTHTVIYITATFIETETEEKVCRLHAHFANSNDRVRETRG